MVQEQTYFDFHFFNQRLKAWAIEIHTRKAIIRKMSNVTEPISTGIIFQVFLLIDD